MNKKIYVGNLAFSTTESAINELFSQYGTVISCRLVTEKDTNQSKGFAFVEMSSFEEAEKAIAGLNNHNLDGRELKISEARPQVSRSGFSGSMSGSFDRSSSTHAATSRKRHHRGSF